MERTYRLFVIATGIALALAGLLLVGPATQVAVGQDDSQPNDGGGDAEQQAAAARSAIAEVCVRFRDAYAAGDADGVWNVLSEASRQSLENDLDELRKALQALPADRMDEALPGGATPRQLLALNSAREYLGHLLSGVDAETRRRIGTLGFAAGDVTLAGDTSATLDWTPTDEQIAEDRMLRFAAQSMPTQATKDEAGWRIVITGA